MISFLKNFIGIFALTIVMDVIYYNSFDLKNIIIDYFNGIRFWVGLIVSILLVLFFKDKKRVQKL
ncbi:MAG: hypothetical protein CND43_00410 [Flavobacteriales bacterium MED-G15]|nr:MAG: hypothetical protein CND43_00410 [Flavobacteriales bacterium MED-G15]